MRFTRVVGEPAAPCGRHEGSILLFVGLIFFIQFYRCGRHETLTVIDVHASAFCECDIIASEVVCFGGGQIRKHTFCCVRKLDFLLSD